MERVGLQAEGEKLTDVLGQSEAIWKLTVVLDQYEAMESYSRIGLVQSYGNYSRIGLVRSQENFVVVLEQYDS